MKLAEIDWDAYTFEAVRAEYRMHRDIRLGVRKALERDLGERLSDGEVYRFVDQALRRLRKAAKVRYQFYPTRWVVGANEGAVDNRKESE